VETAAFSGAFEARPNPCTLETCAGHLERMARSPLPFHAVAFTGGEPLLHADFIAALLPRARRLFPRTYLDTNATLPRELATIVDGIDIVSLGVKLPSCEGTRTAWREAEACLRIAARSGSGRTGGAAPKRPRSTAARRRVFLKVVVTRESTPREVGRAAALAAAVRPRMPMILQPVTPRPDGPRPPDATRLRTLLSAAARHLDDVRVLPQLHPLLGWK
jgi:organic radical activating enzyme